MRTPINTGLLQTDCDFANFKAVRADLSDYAGANIDWNAVTKQFDGTGGGGGGGFTPHIDNYYWIGNYASAGQMAGTSDATAAVQAALDAIQAAMLANGGGRYVLDIGDSILRIDGPLQETSGRNAQLLLPKIAIFTDKQCSLIIQGSAPPNIGLSVVGGIPKPTKGGRIVSTLTTGSGTTPSLMATALTGYSIMLLVLKNFEIETAPNPFITAVNAGQAGMLQVDNVLIDTGSYSTTGVTTPTHSGSYGLITPLVNNDALTMLRNAVVVGFYNGFQFNEHTYGDNITAMGNLVAAEVPANYHASHINRFLMQHNVVGIKATGGTSRLSISQLDIEHADGSTDAFVTTADVSDASNFLKGYANYAVVLQNVGISSTFTKTGGATFYCTELGANSPLYIGTDARLVAVSGGAKLEARNTGTGTWVEAARWTNP